MTPIDPRIQLSLERTMLSWTRTGLALMGFGFIVARLSLGPEDILILWVGIISILLGVAVNLLAGIEYSRYLKYLREENMFIETKYPLGKLLTFLLSGIGVLLSFYFIIRIPGDNFIKFFFKKL